MKRLLLHFTNTKPTIWHENKNTSKHQTKPNKKIPNTYTHACTLTNRYFLENMPHTTKHAQGKLKSLTGENIDFIIFFFDI
jgi:hypothetical protein